SPGRAGSAKPSGRADSAGWGAGGSAADLAPAPCFRQTALYHRERNCWPEPGTAPPTPSGAMPQGYLCLVLHAHLPFVRHPEYDDFLEEDWLYEAITETYIPLLEVMEGLERDGADWR